jgi:hypothetical protein
MDAGIAYLPNPFQKKKVILEIQCPVQVVPEIPEEEETPVEDENTNNKGRMLSLMLVYSPFVILSISKFMIN